MSRKLAALSVAVAAMVLAACGSRYAGSGAPSNTSVLPGMPDIKMTVTLPDGSSTTAGEELPTEGVGEINDTHWKATLGGFTQEMYSQALGFPPGTKITLTNLSKDITHTLDVVKKIKKAPANFPQNPTLSIPAKGNGILGKGYASGPISPGKSVTVTLSEKGIYLIGCAFHYADGMKDVIVVKTGATPGPEATPPRR